MSVDGAIEMRAGMRRVMTRSLGRRPAVALVAHNVHGQGGMERACVELISRGGDSCRFIVFSSELAPELRRLVQWEQIRVPQRPFPLKYLAFAAVAGWRMRRCDVDVRHTLGAIVPNRVDLAIVHSCHAGFRARTGRLAPPERTPLRRVNTALSRLLAIAAERWCYRPGRVRILAPVSRGVEQELQRHYPHVPTRLTPNGLDIDRVRPVSERRNIVRSSEGVAEDDVVVLFVGGDWDHKGLAVAIKGIAGTNESVRNRFRLWIVGRGDERRFRAIAEQQGVGQLVSFFGVRTDPERFYQAADVFLLPTLYETFSLAGFEAAASGLPVVAPAVSGINELIGEDEAGIVVDRAPESVGAALSRLAADPDLRTRMGAEGRRRASAYTWERSVESVLSVYAELLGEPVAVKA
jgi:UDP-glucose:(heptosyl)LPS alpha-1,3-glucosyltransferase